MHRHNATPVLKAGARQEAEIHSVLKKCKIACNGSRGGAFGQKPIPAKNMRGENQ